LQNLQLIQQKVKVLQEGLLVEEGEKDVPEDIYARIAQCKSVGRLSGPGIFSLGANLLFTRAVCSTGQLFQLVRGELSLGAHPPSRVRAAASKAAKSALAKV
jgi:hypothetical protein